MVADNKRDQIIGSAHRLVVSRGVDGMRLRDIADEAKVSIGTIQYYFGSRDDVVREMLTRASENRVQDWTKKVGGIESGLDRLRILLEGSVSSVERCVIWVETCAASTRHSFLRKHIQEVNDAWRSWLIESLERAVEQGELNLDRPPEHFANLFVAVVDGYMLAVASKDQKITLKQAKEAIVDVAERALGTVLSAKHKK